MVAGPGVQSVEQLAAEPLAATRFVDHEVVDPQVPFTAPGAADASLGVS